MLENQVAFVAGGEAYAGFIPCDASADGHVEALFRRGRSAFGAAALPATLAARDTTGVELVDGALSLVDAPGA